MTASMRHAEGIAPELLLRIVEELGRYLTPGRIDRMDRALLHRTRDLVVVLEDVFDDHNASAVLRTAEALGLLEVHFVPRKVPLRLSHKISRGAHKWLDLRIHSSPKEAFDALRSRGFSIWAADVRGPAVPLGELPIEPKLALVFGNEHAGLSEDALSASDGRFRVPMHGFVESLNISVAASISMYDVLTRRAQAGVLGGLSDSEKAVVRASWYASSVRASAQILREAGLPTLREPAAGLTFVDEVVECEGGPSGVSSDGDVGRRADLSPQRTKRQSSADLRDRDVGPRALSAVGVLEDLVQHGSKERDGQ